MMNHYEQLDRELDDLMAAGGNIPEGYCKCGCGQQTTINKENSFTRGVIKGEHRRFIKHHHPKKIVKRKGGYFCLTVKDHPRSSPSTPYIPIHVLIVEKVLGKYLPLGAVVHHINGDHRDNRPENLFVCPNSSYHKTLHIAQRALINCGHADWRKCIYCHTYDSKENFAQRLVHGKIDSYFHRKCQNKYNRDRRNKKNIRERPVHNQGAPAVFSGPITVQQRGGEKQC